MQLVMDEMQNGKMGGMRWRGAAVSRIVGYPQAASLM